MGAGEAYQVAQVDERGCVMPKPVKTAPVICNDRIRLASSNVFVSAETLARALRGRKTGSGWMARCRAHDDREPSLAIRESSDGKVLVHCHAGCGQDRVIEALRSRGLWTVNGAHASNRPEARDADKKQLDYHDNERKRSALAIWCSAKRSEGTVVETYLTSRGIRLPLPETICWHSGLKHPSGTTWPAMVALVTRGTDDLPVAVHRTFLAQDGTGKAPVDPQKMMLGPCRGGAVRLAPATDVLMLGEGIETCLAAMQATGHPAWAALSTTGLMALNLPQSVGDVIVLADGDEAGKAAARGAALRWKREGRHVRIAYPPQGMDFNDMLLGRAPTSGEGMQ